MSKLVSLSHTRTLKWDFIEKFPFIAHCQVAFYPLRWMNPSLSVPKKDDLIHIPFVKLINSFKLPMLECDCIDPISLYYFHWICWAYYAFNWNSKDDSEEIVKARCHYRQAEIDGRVIVNLNDNAHVKVSCYWMCFWC